MTLSVRLAVEHSDRTPLATMADRVAKLSWQSRIQPLRYVRFTIGWQYTEQAGDQESEYRTYILMDGTKPSRAALRERFGPRPVGEN